MTYQDLIQPDGVCGPRGAHPHPRCASSEVFEKFIEFKADVNLVKGPSGRDQSDRYDDMDG